MAYQHLPAMLDASFAQHAGLPAQRVKVGDAWQITSYAELDRQVRRLAAALVDMDVAAGDRMAIFAGNRPQWSLADLAGIRIGVAPVSLYATSTSEQVRHILRDSGSVAAVVGGAAEYERLAAVRAELPDLRVVISMDRLDDPGVVALADLLAGEAAPATVAEVDARTAALTEEDLLTIVYTSGTTGEPKGAMLTHANMMCMLEAIHDRFDLVEGERSMSFLPLAHTFERAWTYVVFAFGLENAYVTDPKAVAQAMLDIQPDVFVAVPRLYEKVYAVAHEQAGEGPKRKIFDWAFRVGLDVNTRTREGRTVPAPLKAAHALADKLVLHRVRDAVGGPKRVMACGGAPVRREVLEFFRAADLDVFEGYGLTETAPMISCNSPGHTRIGTVGRPIPGCEVRIGDEGEIQARGRNVFPGYWGNPEATAATFVDGWFKTGDIGHLDGDGYLTITDRLKDLIITAQGKNVAPAPIESALTSHPLVEAAVVIGDDRPYLVALIQPSFPELESLAGARGWAFSSRAQLVALAQVKALYDEIVTAACAGKAHFEQVQKFRLLAQELTMDGGDLTPTLKVKRRTVAARHTQEIEEMYADGATRS